MNNLPHPQSVCVCVSVWNNFELKNNDNNKYGHNNDPLFIWFGVK